MLGSQLTSCLFKHFKSFFYLIFSEFVILLAMVLNIKYLCSCGDGSLGEPPRQGDGQCGNMRLLLRQQQRVSNS